MELMLKPEGFNVYTTDLGEEGMDLGKIYVIITLISICPTISGFAAQLPLKPRLARLE
jgi:two-component system cell cycle response regulator CtrA